MEHGDDMRLLVKNGDWNTVKLLCELEKCRYTESFFKGYRERHPHEKGYGMIWDRELAEKAQKASLQKGANQTGKKKKKKRSLNLHQQRRTRQKTS